MTKQEFLNGLSEALSVTGDREMTEMNLEYYSSYIDSEMSGGKSEETVLQELGDPRLIARSIMDAGGYSNSLEEQVSGQQGGSGSSYGGSSYGGNGDYSGRQDGENGQDGEPVINMFRGSLGWGLGSIALILIVVILLFMGVLYLLSPILLPLIVIIMVMRVLR